QLAVMLYRYAGQPSVEGESKTFADSGDVSAWAGAAMDWAVKTGILTGKTGDRLDPAGFASRAEVSAMLMRFVALKNQA
ncbi:MAG TPA: S-layer homology domain-containing protein, partial [Pseudoflavonifractor sp.]|nr:S-layer homology domain-containing protein [Pseudoflavonifractor sp.]